MQQPGNYNRLLNSTIVFRIFFLVTLFPETWIQAGNLENSIECLMCRKNHKNTDQIVTYKGMEIPLCSEGCKNHYKDASDNNTLDSFTSRIEPRSALFQEDSQTEFNLSKLFFWIGYYIFIGLIFGGSSAYIAVQKGITPWSAFILGFLLNIIGFIIIVLKPEGDRLFHSRGLAKVPVTHNETICKSCDHSNHPSAEKCSHCETSLVSSVTSEVSTI